MPVDPLTADRFHIHIAFTPAQTDKSFIILQFDDGTNANRITFGYHYTDDHVGVAVFDGGVSTGIIHDPPPPFVLRLGEENRATIVIDKPGNRTGISFNGSPVTWSDAATFPDVDTIRLGSAAGGGTMPGTIDFVEYLAGLPSSAAAVAWSDVATFTPIVGSDGVGDTLTGTSGDDHIVGDTAYDAVLAGQAAADTMAGGLGDDRYWVNHAGDQVIEAANGGHDIVYSEIDFRMAGGLRVEELHADRPFDLLLAGNQFAQDLIGGNGANTLSGGGGDDEVSGGFGNDVLHGGAGMDTLIGGRGADAMTGGTGLDLFVFQSRHDLGLGAGRDLIRDFAAGQETVDLSALPAFALTFRDEGTTRIARVDLGSNGTIDGEIAFLNGLAIGAGDFIL